MCLQTVVGFVVVLESQRAGTAGGRHPPAGLWSASARHARPELSDCAGALTVLVNGRGVTFRIMATLAPVPALRGRATETQVLAEALDGAVSGRAAVVLIEGEAGIGKTRLLDQALADAASQGMQVAAARAVELEQTRPFGLVASAFGCARDSWDPRRAAIAGLLAAGTGGELGPITVTSDPGLRFRVVDALADLAEELALTGPMVIGVDDLQWADPSSLLTLGTLSRRLAGLPVVLIGCLRPSPRVAELDRLAAAVEVGGGRHMALRALADQAVVELVTEMVAAEPGPALLAGISGAAGNPLFVTELLGALAQEGAIRTSAGRAEVAVITLPPTLRLTILHRLSFLPGDALHALRAASILGSRFTLTDLAAVTGRSALELSVTLAEAVRAHVIEDDGTALRFRHDLIRDAIYDDIPLSVRHALHREAGQRLAESGAPAMPVAEQLSRGASKGDAAAIGWLTRAAREAVASSPEIAAELLGQAIGLMEGQDPGRDRALAEQADSLMLAGRIPEAQAACRALLDRDHDQSVEGAARMCLGRALLAGGLVRDGLRELEQAARSPLLTAAQRAGALAWAGFARFSLGDLGGAAAAAGQATSAASRVDDCVTISIAMTTLARVCESRGQFGGALEIIDDAVRRADESHGRQGHRYPVNTARGHILIELGRPVEGRTALETGQRISEELGVRWPLASYEAYLGVERFASGEWDDAVAELEASLELAAEIGETYSRIYAYNVLSLIALHRNDLRRAEESAAAAARELAGTGPRYRAHWVMWVRALLLEAGGQSAEALVTLARCWDQCVSSGLAQEYPVFGADLIRLALAHGEPGRAREVAAAVTEMADKDTVPCLAGAALRCQGLVEHDADALRAAVAVYARGSRPLELALASEEAGTILAREGMQDQGRPLLDRAIEIYERLGAVRDVARAESLLREAGIRRGRRGPRARPRIGWASLTPTEHTVAGLVAEGLSNPQIGERLYVSRRTVQAHLAHVFAKLDIATRAQLAAEVTRRAGDGSGRPVG